jgi:hypothetical protein
MVARFSRSAEACRDIIRLRSSGMLMSSKRMESTWMPQALARLSTTSPILAWIWSRSLSSSSRVMLPMTSRSEAWAYWEMA